MKWLEEKIKEKKADFDKFKTNYDQNSNESKLINDIEQKLNDINKSEIELLIKKMK